MKTLQIKSEDEMLRFGKSIGELVKPGDFLFLSGELGAGKTTLVKGIGCGLGLNQTEVTSPTFQLKKTYRGRYVLNHLDLYRLQNPLELEILEPDELGDEGVTVVEWGELLHTRLRTDYLEIKIEFTPDFEREVSLIPHGSRYQRLIEELSDVNIGD